MRIVCPITVGAVLLTIAVAAGKGAQAGMTAVARVPRALILQPVSKLREEEEDGPLDWLANMFRGMISPRKRQPPYHQPPMLGPIRIPGMDDEVYIKQLGSLANSQSRVIVRMMTPGRGQPGPMSPATYYTYQPVFPAAPTRQIPVQPPGFAPMASPTPTAPWPQPQAMRPHSPTSYNKNMYPSHGYPQPNMYPNQFRPSVPLHQSHYDPPYSPRYTQNPYGTYDFDNSIPHGRGSRFGPDPIRTTNYPLYPPLKDHHNFNGQVHHDHEIRNQSASSEEVYDDSRESDVRYADAESKEILNESKVTDKYKEIYRPDRMVPTNPTWRNRFWTRTHRTTTASPTTEGSEDEGKNKSTKDGKFSSTEIREIVAPDLKDWKERTEKGEREEEKRRTDSRMDEGEGKDGVALGKGESREFVEKRVLSVRMADAASEGPRAYAKIQARKRSNWTPILPKPTQLPVYSGGSQGNSAEVSSTEAARETTTRANEEEANATRDHSRRHEGKRHSKVYQRKIGKRDRRVRIVESVSSSVSVSSSRGKGVKPKST